ncbi:hypothetical protein IAQ61_003161 [Plenodomus lingam]|uniref:uncharacterized protein n=1 Tax=Leptosphaeria maculans TaxID=5022 RepID=UPI003331754A|nr:hypothetical protein IAQ61_003161 [Plenodomus lingam]
MEPTPTEPNTISTSYRFHMPHPHLPKHTHMQIHLPHLPHLHPKPSSTARGKMPETQNPAQLGGGQGEEVGKPQSQFRRNLHCWMRDVAEVYGRV